jgi:hypothetical protein
MVSGLHLPRRPAAWAVLSAARVAAINPDARGAVKGAREGRVFTTACGRPAASSCTRQAYRGSLVFCKTPRWVWIAAGRVTTLDINGGNATF